MVFCLFVFLVCLFSEGGGGHFCFVCLFFSLFVVVVFTTPFAADRITYTILSVVFKFALRGFTHYRDSRLKFGIKRVPPPPLRLFFNSGYTSDDR